LNAGGKVQFEDLDWSGYYQLKPYPIYDSARWLTANMYKTGTFMCLSFHWNKTLGIQQGGAILHDDPEADKILRKMRFDGRTEGVAPHEDEFIRGWHCYMSPEIAAEGLVRLANLSRYNEPMPNDRYPDLSKASIF
jgi:dTDP-4-amino-4,6-dideoxygalactose transaminase